MKKKLAVLIAGVMIISTMFGCSSAGSNSSTDSVATDGTEAVSAESELGSAEDGGTGNTKEKAKGGVTLSLYGIADNLAKPYMLKIISLYEEKTGNKIEVQGLDTENAETISLTKFTTGDIPDLYIHFGNAQLKNFNPEENFVDWTNAEWVSDIKDSILPQALYNDKVIGLPFSEVSNSGCIYNKKIFEELGIEEPKSQDEFNAACATLLENGIQPIYLAGADSWPLLYQYPLDPIMDDNPEYVDKLNAGEMNYADIPEFTDMCEWYKMSADKGYFGKTFVSDKWDYTSEVLGTGEAAMIFGWDTWFDTDYDNESYEYKVEDFGIMPAFMGTCDEGTYEGGNVVLMLANKNGERVQEAMDFINFMATPEYYDQAFDGIATAAVFNNQTTNVNSVQYEENKESVDKLIRASGAQPKIIGYNQAEGGKALLQLMTGEISVEQCIKLIDDDRNATREALADQ